MTVASEGTDRATDSGEEAKSISNLTGRSGSRARFRKKTIFAVCCSCIESTDYGANKNIHTWQKGGCFWPSDLVDDVVWRPSTMFGFGLLLRVLENWSFHSRARLWQNTISHLQLTFKVNTQANTSHSATKVKYAVLWYIPTTDPCSSSQGLSWRIQKSPKKKINFPKVVHINHCPRK